MCPLPRAWPRVCTDTDRAVFAGAGRLTVPLFILQRRWGASGSPSDSGVQARKWARKQEEEPVAILAARDEGLFILRTLKEMNVLKGVV